MFHRQDFIRHKASVLIAILVVGLAAFEMFNLDSTRFALDHLMANQRLWGLEWGLVLALAFGSIDFAGLARILTPATTWEEEPREVWFLTGAWLLGATMNAVMTWYAMVVLMTARGVQTGVGIVDQTAVLDIAPVFIAVMVWLTRVLLISSLALALERAAAAPSPAAQSRTKRHSPSGAPLRENGRVPLSANGHEG